MFFIIYDDKKTLLFVKVYRDSQIIITCLLLLVTGIISYMQSFNKHGQNVTRKNSRNTFKK